MQAYNIDYTVKERKFNILIDAKDVKRAKKKIGRKHDYKDGRMVKIEKVMVVGFY
mgnify:CR=1 FL=1